MDKQNLQEFINREMTFQKLKERIKYNIDKNISWFTYPIELMMKLSEKQFKELISLISKATIGDFDIRIVKVECKYLDKDNLEHIVLRDKVVFRLNYPKIVERF